MQMHGITDELMASAIASLSDYNSFYLYEQLNLSLGIFFDLPQCAGHWCFDFLKRQERKRNCDHIIVFLFRSWALRFLINDIYAFGCRGLPSQVEIDTEDLRCMQQEFTDEKL